MIMAGCSSAGEMVMMGYCCRSSSLSHSGVRGERRRDGEGDRLIVREREAASAWGEKALIPIGPEDMRV